MDITVFIQTYSEQYVYVGGQVATLGIVRMDRRRKLTALEAIVLAGGINTENAHYGNIMLVRHKDGK